MNDDAIGNRKLDHIDLALNDGVKTRPDAGWDGVRLVPAALPGIDIDDVDLSLEFLDFQLAAPLFIAGMTGGHADVEVVNARLATAAEACGVALGVGSQRAALGDPELVQSYAVTRQKAPNAFICGNIGISQIVDPVCGIDTLKRLIDMVEANALAVHINVLQELIQPEGEIELSRAWSSLEETVKAAPVPVIVKETGCGVDGVTAKRLAEIGVAAVDTGGTGGTSFVRIEGVRAGRAGEEKGARLADTFANWGLSTVQSLLEVRDAGIPVIATGGVANGLHAAKALALGAALAGVGRAMLAAAMVGSEETVTELTTLIEELRITLLLSDCRGLEAFRKREAILEF